CSRHTPTDVWFVSAFRARRNDRSNPALCRDGRATVRHHGGGVVLRPRGPRSCPGYAVSNRAHLIDPIRPTREHIAISPHSGLYAMPSLCGSAEATRGWFRAFADHSFLACRSLCPRGARSSLVQTSMPTWPSPSSEQLGTPNLPAIRFTRGTSFGASWLPHLLRSA